MRFTIRGFLIAVVVIAGLLAVPTALQGLVTTLAIPCVAGLVARWLFVRGYRRGAGACFWGLGIVVNVAYVGFCIAPRGLFSLFLCVLWFGVVLPTLAGLGAVWALLTEREGAASGRSSSRVWVVVGVLTVLPLVTAFTVWPFRLNFLMAKSRLESLADQVAAGKAVNYPVWAGLFRIAGAAVDPASGNMALMIDPNPNGPTGFVRSPRPTWEMYGCYRPIRGDVLHVSLGHHWCYHEED